LPNARFSCVQTASPFGNLLVYLGGVENLPPFYTQSVQVAPAQVLSEDLINAVKNGV